MKFGYLGLGPDAMQRRQALLLSFMRALMAATHERPGLSAFWASAASLASSASELVAGPSPPFLLYIYLQLSGSYALEADPKAFAIFLTCSSSTSLDSLQRTPFIVCLLPFCDILQYLPP